MGLDKIYLVVYFTDIIGFSTNKNEAKKLIESLCKVENRVCFENKTFNCITKDCNSCDISQYGIDELISFDKYYENKVFEDNFNNLINTIRELNEEEQKQLYNELSKKYKLDFNIYKNTV